MLTGLASLFNSFGWFPTGLENNATVPSLGFFVATRGLDMNKFKSLLKRCFARCKSMAFAIAFALGFCSVARAQSSATSYDIDVVKDIADKLEATLTKFWTDNKEAILVGIGLIVAFGLIWLVIKVWNKCTRKAG